MIYSKGSSREKRFNESPPPLNIFGSLESGGKRQLFNLPASAVIVEDAPGMAIDETIRKKKTCVYSAAYEDMNFHDLRQT